MENSPISRPPIELRLQIYKLVLQHERNILIGPHWPRKLLHLPPSPKGSRHHSKCEFLPPLFLAVAQTCRQMRQESLPLFYSNNNFHILFRPSVDRLSDSDKEPRELVSYLCAPSLNEVLKVLIPPVEHISQTLDKIDPCGEISVSITVDIMPWSSKFKSEGSAKLLRQILEYLDDLRKLRSCIRLAVYLGWKLPLWEEGASGLERYFTIGVSASLDDNFATFTRFLMPRPQLGLGRELIPRILEWLQSAGLTLREEPDISHLQRS